MDVPNTYTQKRREEKRRGILGSDRGISVNKKNINQKQYRGKERLKD